MRTYQERAKDFIKEFAPYCKGCKTKWDYTCAVRHYMEEHPRRHVKVKTGATRIALITSDYVIKLDVSHSDAYYWAGNCANEYSNYLRAVEEGFEHLFAACDRYRCRARYFYIMPLVRNLGKGEWDINLTDDEYNYIEDNVSDLHEENYGRDSKTGKVVIIDYAPY